MSSSNQVPWDDKELQVWGLAWRANNMPRYDLMFECHQLGWQREKMGDEYVKHLAKLKCPIVMLEKYEEVPGAVVFPADEIAEWGGHYYASSVAYMIAYAIHEGATEINIYGVDMLTETEYQVQRPNCEYWLGLARGAGITVNVAPGSALLKANFTYGVEKAGKEGGLSEAHLTDRKKFHKEKCDELRAQVMQIEGALKEFDVLLGIDAIKAPTKGQEAGMPFDKFVETRKSVYKKELDFKARALWTHDGARQESETQIDYLRNYKRGGIVPGKSHVGDGRNDAGTVAGSLRGDRPDLSEIGGLGVAETRRVPATDKRGAKKKKPCNDCGDEHAAVA